MELVLSGKVILFILWRTPLKAIGDKPTPATLRYVWVDPHPFMK